MAPKKNKAVEIPNDQESDAQFYKDMYAKMSTIDSKLTELQKGTNAHFAHFEKELSRLNKLVTTIAAKNINTNNHNSRIGFATASTANTGPANLSKCPKSLEVLWNEWENGIDGNKPAREFTRTERGKVKYVYSRRLVVWKVIERLIGKRDTVKSAIQKIYKAYGYESVTKIIDQLRRDERSGGHPQLR